MNQSGRGTIAIYLVAVAAGLMAVFGSQVKGRLTRFRLKAEESAIKANADALNACEEAYFHEWHHYSENLKDIGFAPEDSTQVYLQEKEVPKNYLSVLQKNDLPTVGKNSYRLLLVQKIKANGETEFWTTDQGKILQKRQSINLGND